MHDIKLSRQWINEAGQSFAAGVMLRVSLPLAHRLVAENYATAFRPLPELPEPAPAPLPASAPEATPASDV